MRNILPAACLLDAIREDMHVAEAPRTTWRFVLRRVRSSSPTPRPRSRGWSNNSEITIAPQELTANVSGIDRAALPVRQWLQLAEAVEAEGAFKTALWVIDCLLNRTVDAFPAARTSLWARRGRILRQLGASDEARFAYHAALRLRRKVPRDDDGVGYALLGLGSLSGQHGNYPEARRRFGELLKRTEGAGTLAIEAHQGLMLVARAQGRLLDAFLHGWTAFDMAGQDQPRQVGLVTGLASCAEAAERHADALAGYLAAMNAAPHDRFLVPALVGAIRAGTQLADWQTIDGCIARGLETLARHVPPFDEARFWLAVAQSEAARGRRAQMLDAMAKAATLADTFAFHEIRFRVDALNEESTSRAARAEPAPGALATPTEVRIRSGAARLSAPDLLTTSPSAMATITRRGRT